jgi:hypothetical protein
VAILGKWFANIREQISASITALLEEGEAISTMAFGETGPHELLTWLPFIRIFFERMRKSYVLVLTNRRLIVTRLKQTFNLGWKCDSSISVPLSQVQQIQEHMEVTSSHLVVTLSNGTKTRYKKVDQESARAFVVAFESLRIGQAPIHSFTPPPLPKAVGQSVGSVLVYEQPKNNGYATAALILGIASIPTCGCFVVVPLVCGILAIVFARKATRLNAGGNVLPAPSWMIKTGYYCGCVGIFLGFLTSLYWFKELIVYLISN